METTAGRTRHAVALNTRTSAATLVSLAAASTVGSLLANSVRLYSKRPALEDGEKRFTFAELGERVNRTCSLLASLGVQPSPIA